MKSEKHEGFLNAIWYGWILKSGYRYYHRINGPAYIQREIKEKKKIKYVEYILFNKTFYPWWLNEI